MPLAKAYSYSSYSLLMDRSFIKQYLPLKFLSIENNDIIKSLFFVPFASEDY